VSIDVLAYLARQIRFRHNPLSEFAFGVVNGTMGLGDSQSIVCFNWTGCDEGDQVNGSDRPNSKTTALSKSSYPFTTAMTRS
jgi:hypothetical protein